MPYRILLAAMACAAALLTALPVSLRAQTVNAPGAGAPLPVQDPAAIAAEVEAFLLDQAQALPGTPTIVVTPPRINRQAACEHLDLFLTNPQLRGGMGEIEQSTGALTAKVRVLTREGSRGSSCRARRGND